MKLDRKLFCMTMGLLLGAPVAHAAPIAKQLAGPPADFATMRAPEPAAAAILSKSALLPVKMSGSKASGYRWQTRIPVENGKLRFLLLSGGDRSWAASLTSPTGHKRSAAALAKSVRTTEFGLEKASYPAEYYALEGLDSGAWELSIDAADAGSHAGFVLIEGDSATELSTYPSHGRQRVGETQGITAMLAASGADDAIMLGNAAGTIAHASLRVTAPDGSVRMFDMHDDGQHGDGLAADGVYGGEFPATMAGNWLAQVMVEGSNRSGGPILRTSEHLLAVVEPSLRIVGTRALGKSRAGDRFAIAIPVDAAKAAQHYRAWAEVWGTDAAGAPTAVAWVGGMVSPAAGAIELGLDQRWLVLSGARAPYELRNLRLEHPDNSVTVAAADRLALALPAVRSKLRAAPITIDERMTQGPRPPRAKGVGTRLLLVHGYCSGGVWPAAQFSNASSFLDANQNRSHDQFARLIAGFGSTWNSFGVVAHSQGGAAALHLYNYYWSGLDYATGPRLIQSVGTPYRGTNLSGILAALGSWFGVGCGTNTDLTYSGSSAWLAGIATSNRAKVNYYTTAFRSTNWWTNDYCNFATDLVLSDPEDGTTEQTYGQLSGGVNRGHTTGQCHTTGMRDPAQFLDSARNATMNANAAR